MLGKKNHLTENIKENGQEESPWRSSQSRIGQRKAK